jgi:hypothetical protein
MKFRFVFWDVLPWKVIVERRFKGTCCLHQGDVLPCKIIVDRRFSGTCCLHHQGDVLPCKIIVDRRFRGTCCLHHQGSLMMEAARTSETSVDNYFTRQYIPEDKSELQLSSL